MSVADFLNDFNKDAFSLNKHPLTGLKFEDRENYLMALSLIMFADGKASESEKKLFDLLVKSLGLDDDFIDDCMNFGSKPESKRMVSIKQTLQNKDVWLPFMSDAFTIAYVSDGLSPEESEAIDLLKKMTGIPDDLYNQGQRLGQAIAECGDGKDTFMILKHMFAKLVELTADEKKQIRQDFCRTEKISKAIKKLFETLGADWSNYSEEERIEAFILFGNKFNKFIEWTEKRGIEPSGMAMLRLGLLKVAFEAILPPNCDDVFFGEYAKVVEQRTEKNVEAYRYMMQMAEYVGKNINVEKNVNS